MAKVYEYVDMSCLPDEYLPDDYDGPSAGPTKQIIGNIYCFNFFAGCVMLHVCCVICRFCFKIKIVNVTSLRWSGKIEESQLFMIFKY